MFRKITKEKKREIREDIIYVILHHRYGDLKKVYEKHDISRRHVVRLKRELTDKMEGLNYI